MHCVSGCSGQVARNINARQISSRAFASSCAIAPGARFGQRFDGTDVCACRDQSSHHSSLLWSELD